MVYLFKDTYCELIRNDFVHNSIQQCKVTIIPKILLPEKHENTNKYSVFNSVNFILL